MIMTTHPSPRRLQLARRARGTGEWRVTIHDAADPVGREALARLLADPQIVVCDEIDAQLQALVVAQNPGIEADGGTAAIRRLSRRKVGDRPRSEVGRWVHYPWLRTVVHVLDPGDLRALRTDRNAYKITPEEQRLLASATIAVCGLSVGQATAVTLALEGVGGHFRLADFDELCVSNLNRLRAGVHQLGLNKAIITARALLEIDPYLDIAVEPAGVTADRVDAFLVEGGPADLLVEECDSLDIKLLLRERARAHRIPVVMETSDRGMLDVERYDLEPDRPILHGLVGSLSASDLGGLSRRDKVQHVLRILEPTQISDRFAATLPEIDRTVHTWPQLGSGVTLGAAVITDTARRILLGTLSTSGRFRIDLDRLVSPGSATLARARSAPVVAAPPPARSVAPPQRARLGDIEEVVAAAISAPSGGNCQPWLFRPVDGALECTLDRARSATLLDADGVAGLLACGAAGEAARLSAQALGFDAHLEVCPEGPMGPAWRLSLRPDPSAVVDNLVEQLPRRVTNRRLGPRAALPATVVPAMRTAVAAHGARLEVHDDSAALDTLGEIIGATDRVRFLSPALHGEMMSELRWNAPQASDGIDVATLELDSSDRAGLELLSQPRVVRFLDRHELGDALADGARKAVAAASAVALISVPATGPHAAVTGGRAVMAAWLEATRHGVALQPLSALPYLLARVEQRDGQGLREPDIRRLASLREPYRHLFPADGPRTELLLFRLAIVGAPTARSSRRPVDAVLMS